MSLQAKITEDLKGAMKARDHVRLDTLRAVLTELKNLAIAHKTAGKDGELSEADELAVLSRAKKQREESVVAFRAGGREELAANEEAQIAVLLDYLPKQLTEAEVIEIAQDFIRAAGITSKKEVGKVMGKLMAAVKGRFPGDRVKALVEDLLA